MLFFHMVFCQSVVCLILQAYQLFVVCMLIELDDGKIYKKALYLMVKTMVSCRFSLKPIQWYAVQQSNRTWLSSGERRLRFRAMDIRWYSLYGSHGPWAMELQSEFSQPHKKIMVVFILVVDWWLLILKTSPQKKTGYDYWFWWCFHDFPAFQPGYTRVTRMFDVAPSPPCPDPVRAQVSVNSPEDHWVGWGLPSGHWT